MKLRIFRNMTGGKKTGRPWRQAAGRSVWGIAAVLMLSLSAPAQVQPRGERALAHLQIIDFSIPQQTGATAPLAERMAFYKIPGVSVTLIDHGAIAWERSAGVLKAGDPAPVKADSLFEAGSVSKFVTAALVLHFVDRGVLDLDADVNHYLKSWKIPDNEFTKKEKVTLRRLLSHQAGLPAQANLADDASLGQILSGTKPAANPPAVPECEPGSRWNYSNIGYVVIQLVLEDLSGKPLAQLAHEVLFKPLGMQSSFFSYPLPARFRPKEAMPHGSDGLSRPPAVSGPVRSPGGLLCTTGDLALLTLEVMKAYQGEVSRVFSQASAKLMLSKQIQVPATAMGLPLSNGLGVFLDETTDAVCFLHPGHNTPGSTFVVIAYPTLGQGAVIAANGNVGDRLYLEILAGLAVEYGWPSGQPFKRRNLAPAGGDNPPRSGL